jgi:hypothetical protein
MRMNDPTSTVRESEFSMGEGVGGLPGYAQAYFEKVTGGGRLTDEQRQEILNAAQQSWAAQQEAQSEIYKEYEGVARRYEMDPRQVLGEMEKQPVREVTRMTKDGRRAVFNAATKEFLRYE